MKLKNIKRVTAFLSVLAAVFAVSSAVFAANANVPGDAVDFGDWAEVVFYDETGTKALTEEVNGSAIFYSDYVENNSAQIFRVIKHLDDGSYKIKSIATGRCFDLNNSASTDGSRVGMHTDNGSPAQRWTIRKNGDTYIIQKFGSSLVIGFNDNGTTAIYTYAEEKCAFTVPDIIDNGGLTGDVDENGILDSRDTAWILKYLLNKNLLNKSTRIIADYDTNGSVDVRDAAALEKYLAKKAAEAKENADNAE